MKSLWQDLRYGVRLWLKSPALALVAVLTLSLGIGANTALFSVVNGVLLRPLPYRDGDRLVVLRQEAPLAGISDLRFSAPEVRDYRAQSRTLKAVAEYHTEPFVLFGLDEPARVQAGVVSAEFFRLLGQEPILGRNFLPREDEPGSAPVLLLAYDFWQRRFAGDASVIGRSFHLSGASHARAAAYTVVGVLPPSLPFPGADDLYMPLAASPFHAGMSEERAARRLQVTARLAKGATLEEAQAEMAAIAGRLAQAHPDAYPSGYRLAVTPLKEELTGRAQTRLLVLFGAVGLILLLACANIANLLLGRLLERERELAVRAALGASRGRLARQLLAESALLSLAGGAAGSLLALPAKDLLVSFAGMMTPRAFEIRLDAEVLLFTLAVSLGTGLLCGIIPALRSQPDLASALNEAPRSSLGVSRSGLRSALLVAQVAISIILLAGTGLLVRSLIKLSRVDPGFSSEKVLTARVTLNPSKFDDEARQVRFFEAVLAKIDAHPEVVASAVTASVPLAQTRSSSRRFRIEGRPQEEARPAPRADLYICSPGYFKALEVPLARGRIFDERDSADAPQTAIINQAMARYYWGDADPVGDRLSLDDGEPWLAIAGVVGDVRQMGLEREAAHQIFRPYAQFPVGNLILVRTEGDPVKLVQHLRAAVASVDPALPLDSVRTLGQIRSNSLASPRLTTILMTIFAALALLISAAGIGSLTALSVRERRRELGIRLALGARARDILTLVIGQSLARVLCGAALGLVGAFWLTGLLSGLLYEVSATDPLTFAGVALLLASVALAACYLPARRATRVDPMVALRGE